MKNIRPETSRNENYFPTAQLKPQLKSLAIKGTGAAVFAQLFNYGIHMIGTIILARILAPGDFGLVTMVVVISLLLSNFGGNGFTEAIVQEDYIDHRQISTLFWINAGISFLLTLLFMLSAPAIKWFYEDPRLVKITIILGTTIIITGLSTQHLALLQRKMQFYKTSANSVVSVLISVIVSIAMALSGMGYWSLIARHVCLAVTTTLGAWILCSWRPGLPKEIARVKTMVKFALNVYGNFCITYLSRNTDKILIGRHHGAVQLGQYDRAYHLSSMLHNQITVPIANVAVSTLSKLKNDPQKCLQYYLKTLSIIAFIGMPFSSIFTLIGPDLVLLLLGPQWAKAGQIMIAFGPAIGIKLIYGTQTWLHYSMGRADRLLRWTIFGTVITIVFFLMGLPFGALGVAIAYSASFYVLVIPGLLYAGKPIQLKLSHIISAVWKCFISALLSCLFCIYINSFPYVSEIILGLNIFLKLFVSCIFCLSLYLIMVTIFYRSLTPISQFLSLLREMLPGFERQSN